MVEINTVAVTSDAQPQTNGGFFSDLAEDLELLKLTRNRVAIAPQSISTRSNNAVDIPSLSAFVAPVKLVKEDSEAQSSAPATKRLAPEQSKANIVAVDMELAVYPD